MISINATLVAAQQQSAGGIAVAIGGLVAIMLAIGIIKGKLRQAERKLAKAVATKAAQAISKRMTPDSSGPDGGV